MGDAHEAAILLRYISHQEKLLGFSGEAALALAFDESFKPENKSHATLLILQEMDQLKIDLTPYINRALKSFDALAPTLRYETLKKFAMLTPSSLVAAHLEAARVAAAVEENSPPKKSETN